MVSIPVVVGLSTVSSDWIPVIPGLRVPWAESSSGLEIPAGLDVTWLHPPPAG